MRRRCKAEEAGLPSQSSLLIILSHRLFGCVDFSPLPHLFRRKPEFMALRKPLASINSGRHLLLLAETARPLEIRGALSGLGRYL